MTRCWRAKQKQPVRSYHLHTLILRTYIPYSNPSGGGWLCPNRASQSAHAGSRLGQSTYDMYLVALEGSMSRRTGPLFCGHIPMNFVKSVSLSIVDECEKSPRGIGPQQQSSHRKHHHQERAGA